MNIELKKNRQTGKTTVFDFYKEDKVMNASAYISKDHTTFLIKGKAKFTLQEIEAMTFELRRKSQQIFYAHTVC